MIIMNELMEFCDYVIFKIILWFLTESVLFSSIMWMMPSSVEPNGMMKEDFDWVKCWKLIGHWLISEKRKRGDIELNHRLYWHIEYRL